MARGLADREGWCHGGRWRADQRPGARLGWLAAFCLLLAMVASGCQSPLGPGFTEPTVAVDGFDLRRPGLFTQEISVAVSIHNEMARDLVIQAVDLELELNGRRLGSGTVLRPITLAAGGTAKASVPLKVKTQDIISAILMMTRDPSLAYAVSGHIRLTNAAAGIGDADGIEVVPFSEDGELDLPVTPSGLEVMNGEDAPKGLPRLAAFLSVGADRAGYLRIR